jgi:hypothetical protein
MRRPALPSLAAALGHPENVRLVVLHQDDVGMCHGANVAFLELSRTGGITCGAAMVPCPWFPEIAAAARERELDLGIHLTLTSEWPQYRWAPVSSAGQALTDPHGYFPRTVPELRTRLDSDVAEVELRAQIDRAIAMGIRPTHLDTHMGACLVPELRALYIRLGREYRLPVLLPRAIDTYVGVLNLGPLPVRDDGDYLALLTATEQPQIDHFRMTPGVDTTEAVSAYRTLLTTTTPGVTFVALHCNAPGDIEAIVPPQAHWRTDEYRLFRSATPQRWMSDAHVVPIGMRAIKNLLYP